jgi:ring-1,2-phenylacetyl-CoA epoxidase subunit PaaE
LIISSRISLMIRFHSLFIKRIEPLTADSVQITLAIAPHLRDAFVFTPGQFLTLRAQIQGESVRRSYSICSTPAQLERSQEISVGIKHVAGGVFSSFATQQLKVGDELDVMPPDGRFVQKSEGAVPAVNRLCIAAGSGITPILSMLGHGLATEPLARYTLVYGNQRTTSIMFGEALQDLKDRYPQRLQLIHVLSRQATELALGHGRIDAEKITSLTTSLIDVRSLHEALLCGPEGMIETATAALVQAGLPAERIHSERFFSASKSVDAIKNIANSLINTTAAGKNGSEMALEVVLDGKTHGMGIAATQNVLDVALEAGLDLPYACKGGVCCTCRAKLIEGKVEMEKNFTLEQWEVDKGFVLTCQARCLSPKVVVSFDER